MSDTPRTDEAAFDVEINGEGGWDSIHWTTGNVMNIYTSAHFSRGLEIENARMKRVVSLARDAVESGAVDECYLSLLRDAVSALPNAQAQR